MCMDDDHISLHRLCDGHISEECSAEIKYLWLLKLFCLLLASETVEIKALIMQKNLLKTLKLS